MLIDTPAPSHACSNPWLEAIEPRQDIFFVIPIDEFIQFGVVFKGWLGVLNKFLLNAAFVSQIHMQVNRGGLDIFVSQADFDIGNGMTTAEHINSLRMTIMPSQGYPNDTDLR